MAAPERRAGRPTAAPTPVELIARNRELYDDTFGAVWRTVFDGMHGGREFINLGGEVLVRRVGITADLRAESVVLELCSGPGAVAAQLADLYGCQVTGIDLNPNQVAHANAMARQRQAAGLRFIQADACAWTTTERFDAVVSLDAFMLLADPLAALSVARGVLRPSGRLAIATLAAGPDLSPACQDFAERVDGMVNLALPESYVAWAGAAGFSAVTIDDITPLALDASWRMLDAVRGAKDAIILGQGAHEYQGWVRVATRYLEAFQDGELGYVILAGQV